MRTIDKIIIHCSATPEGRDIKMETIKSWHVKGRGWSDIGYHFIIELDGAIVDGRHITKVGAHTKGHNAHSIGICYVGGIDKDKKAKDTRTPEQQTALVNLLDALKKEFPKATIHGHNEFANKACPSFDVASEFGWMNEPKQKTTRTPNKKKR